MTNLANIGVEITSKDAAFIASMRKSTKNVEKFANKSKKEFKEVGLSAKKLIGIFGGLAGISLFGRNVIQSTAQFSKNLKELQAITGATGKDLKFLEQASRDLSAASLQNGADVLTAMKLVASAKPELLSNVQALKDTTKEVIALAEASGTDMQTAVQAAIVSLNQYGASSKEAARFVNVLAAGAKFGSAEVSEASQSLLKSAAAAKAAGVSFEELNALIQVLGANGQKLEVAGTGINMVLSRLTTQADNNFNPAVVGMSKALENLNKHMASLSGPTAKAIDLKERFGEEAAKIARILIKNNKLFDQQTLAVTGTSEAYKQAAINASSLAAKQQKLSNSYERLKTAIGNAAPITKTMDTTADTFNRAANSIERYGLVLGGLKSITINPIQQAGDNIKNLGFPTNLNQMKLYMQAGKRQQQGPLTSSIVSAPTGADFAKVNINDMIKNGIQPAEKVLKSFIPVIDLTKTTMQKYVEAVKRATGDLTNVVSQRIGSLGSSGFTRILGGVQGTKEQQNTKLIRDPGFERSVASIVDQVLKLPTLGSGSQKKYLENKLPEQMKNLAQMLGSRIRGSGGSAVGFGSGGSLSVVGDGRRKDFSEMIGIFQQLQKFVKETTGQSTKVDLNIKVDASKDFVAKVTSSQDNKSVINTTIGQLLEDTARTVRR